MLYGALDNDDFFMYMGGLATAIRSIDGESPELVVTNTRDPGNPEMTSIDKFIGTEFRSRYVNPTWIEGMQREGYAGAGEMQAFVEYLWGWDATVSEAVDDAMWQESFEVYVEDKHDLDMQAFFDANSPFAYQDMTARMVETIRKDYWSADEATTERLLSEYVESVATYGVGCAGHTCGNPQAVAIRARPGRRHEHSGSISRHVSDRHGGGDRHRHCHGRGCGRGVRAEKRSTTCPDDTDEEPRRPPDGDDGRQRRSGARASVRRGGRRGRMGRPVGGRAPARIPGRMAIPPTSCVAVRAFVGQGFSLASPA